MKGGAGQLDKRVSIQAPAGTQGAAGEPSGQWATLGERWAAIEPIDGRELMQSGGAIAAGTLKVTLRYDPSIALTPACRLLYGSRVLEINSVADIDEAHVWWELMCSEAK